MLASYLVCNGSIQRLATLLRCHTRSHFPGKRLVRDHSVYAPRQWKTALHWLGAYTEWSLLVDKISGFLRGIPVRGIICPITRATVLRILHIAIVVIIMNTVINWNLRSEMRTCVPEAGIKDRDKLLQPTVSVGCNCLPLPLLPGTQVIKWD